MCRWATFDGWAIANRPAWITLRMIARRQRGGARIISDRLSDIADAALFCFIDRGFRLTQVADVTERLGLSVGAIYRYVESKEALLHLAVLHAGDALPQNMLLPVRVAGTAEIVRAARRLMSSGADLPGLKRLLAQAGAERSADTAHLVAAGLYDRLFASARLITVVDKCAGDIPELARIFDNEVRSPFLDDLAIWVDQSGNFAGRGDLDISTMVRGATEAVGWLAINRRRDRCGKAISDANARSAAIEIFTRALAPD